MEYPQLPKHLLKEDLIEHFTLTDEEKQLIGKVADDQNALGCAVILKTFLFLGYPPPSKKSAISADVIEWLAAQLEADPASFGSYNWRGRTFERHLSVVRAHSGFRPCKEEDKPSLADWLFARGERYPRARAWHEAAIRRFRELGIELPTASKLRRLVQSAHRRYLDGLCELVASRIDPGARKAMSNCLETREAKSSKFDWLKSRPGRTGMKTILGEIDKLRFIRQFGIDRQYHFRGVPEEHLRRFAQRARGEDAHQMDRHSEEVKLTLLAAVLHVREAQVTDNIVKVFLDLARRIEKRADKKLANELVKEIKKVYGKRQILYKVAQAATGNPDGSVKEVVFSVVSEQVLRRIIGEFEAQETRYSHAQAAAMKQKYTFHYRRMMKPILDNLVFRANNPKWKPVLEGLTLVHKYIESKSTYYPVEEEAPEGLLKGKWKELAIDKGLDGERIVRQYFELCVLSKLEKGIKCKEIWAQGAYRYRNPDQDLPSDWTRCRVEHCRKHGIPERVEEFIEPIKKEVAAALIAANRKLTRKDDVYIYQPGGADRGYLRVPKIKKRPERPILAEVKSRVIERWGVINLVDMMIEADRQTGMSRFFQTSGQRQVLGREQARERGVLCVLSLGTGTGLKRMHAAARPNYSYDDLLYFRQRFVTIEAIREMIVALTNRILELRNPKIWGKATTCASDGKHLPAWDQNLVADFNPHYNRRGVMAYWHVERNSLCVYSQLRRASEIAAMLEGLVRHDTEMRVERNFVDSHGQSEVAFPFCRFLGVELIPRLKRIKYERLYLPDAAMAAELSNLTPILTRPIRWHLIAEQYDEMVKHVVAVLERTGAVDSILRRFNSYNRTNPVYKAFIEAGKALKTQHICNVITSKALRVETEEALNVIENFNSSIDFIRFGRRMELQTNDPESMELMILCAHLLQNAVILANTIMVERVLEEEGLAGKMKRADRRALTPLFTSNVNPYGDFRLDFDKPSFLEAV